MPDLVCATWPAAVLTAEDWEAYEADMAEMSKAWEEKHRTRMDEELEEMYWQRQYDLYHDEDFPF